jgi:hypothetical protein
LGVIWLVDIHSEDKEPTEIPIEGGLSMADSQDRKLKVYEQLCNSYRAIDDFRAKLLALLPLATGGGIFLLVGDHTRAGHIEPYLPGEGVKILHLRAFICFKAIP